MTALTSLARAQAFDTGRAVRIATVRHLHLSGRPLVFVPLALAGEACAPLAAMVGDDRNAPVTLIVAQPRDRAQRFAFADELAAVIVGHIEGFYGQQETVMAGRPPEPRLRYADAPQLWLPSPAGISFARLLGRSTRFRRTAGEHAVPESVPVLGRWLTFLAERSEHPGSSLMAAMTSALGQHWATGQSPVEDANLAALLAWIDPPAGKSGRDAALDAEDPLAWPPAGPSTDPTFDNEVLTRLVRNYDRAAADGGERPVRQARAALVTALASQLKPTWDLMWRGLDLLAALPAGANVARRWDADKEAFTWHAERLREGGPPQAKVDGAVSAARRLARMERAQASFAVQRAFDDPLVMAEHRLTGEAFAGEVVAAERDRIIASGAKRVLRPLITVRTRDDVAVQEGGTVTSPARPSQKALVVSVEREEDGEAATVVLELSGGMGRGLSAPPGSVPEAGEQVTFTTLSDSFQRTPEFPALEDTPWTHGGPPAPYAPTDEDAQEAWS